MRVTTIRRILVGGGVLVLSGSGLAFAVPGLPDRAGDAAEEHAPADAGRPADPPATATSASTAATSTTPTTAAGRGGSVGAAPTHAGTAGASAFGACVSGEAHEDPHDGDEPPADCWDGHPVLSAGPGAAPEHAGAARAAGARRGASPRAGASHGDAGDGTDDD